MVAETRSLIEITQKALRVLYRELGIVNTVRFLNQFTTGLGNYTEERRALIENQTLDEVLAHLIAARSDSHITISVAFNNAGILS